MIKNILIALLVLATLGAIALNVVSRKAPDFIRESLESALNKKVVIQSIDYQFPWVFELSGFEVLEAEPFKGEQSFYVDQVHLEISPLSLSRKKLIINKIEVENANLVIRMYHGKLFHALSGTLQTAGESGTTSSETATSSKIDAARIPLDIHNFLMKRSHFKFIDYDVDEKGFVVTFDDINAKIRGIRLPYSTSRTSYDLSALLVQGRDQKPAEVKLFGWTSFANIDTDAIISLKGVFLPYFKPYYTQVTPASIEDGFLDTRTNVSIVNNDLTASVDIEMINLLFQAYEEENQLFGMKADELLSFLKDRSGKLRFQIVVKWNIADRSVSPRNAIRKSIERSLKSTVLGNIGNILQKTIEKISEKGGFEQGKNDSGGVVSKLKNFFK